MAVDKQTESKFLNDNHYQGYVPSKVAIGLFHDNVGLVCLMTFGKPRYNLGYDWELLRLCTKKDTTVYGGASRLWKHFTSNYMGSVISYCNEDKFKGTVYEVLGFKKTVTKKGYHYEKDGKTYHRTNFQKHMCLKRWPQYDQTWTERRMMEDQGYTRVDDKVGQSTWVYNDRSKWYIYEITCRTLTGEYHYIGQHKYIDTTCDNYMGSGTIVKRMVPVALSVHKKVLVKGIDSQALANRLERAFINESRSRFGSINDGGYNCNIQDGGQGEVKVVWGDYASYGFAGHKHSQETKELMSAHGKGKHDHSGKNNPMWGHVYTDEQRKNMSDAQKKVVHKNGYKATCHWVTQYQNKETLEIKSSKEWLDSGIDIYYHKDKFIKLAPKMVQY